MVVLPNMTLCQDIEVVMTLRLCEMRVVKKTLDSLGIWHMTIC
jgi:hypothetical protein